MHLLSIFLILTCLPSALFDFAIPKWKSDKHIRMEDAYKWTYQATRGGEHAVPDAESARKWLDKEWQTLIKPTDGEPIWEPLCPGGEIGRINLRPFKARGGKADEVLETFLAGSREYKTEQSGFVDAWLELGKRLKKKRTGRLDYKSWVKLDAEMKAKGYPAIHHSSQYEAARRPAYRVVIGLHYNKLRERLK